MWLTGFYELVVQKERNSSEFVEFKEFNKEQVTPNADSDLRRA